MKKRTGFMTSAVATILILTFLCTAAYPETNAPLTPTDQPSGEDLKPKSALTAGLLGGLLGFGSGQYYSKRWITGTLFLLADGFGVFMIAGGISAVNQVDESDSVGGALAGSLGGSYLIGLGGLVLVGSHVIQAVAGPISAERYNRRLRNTQSRWEPFLAPGRDAWRVGVTYNF